MKRPDGWEAKETMTFDREKIHEAFRMSFAQFNAAEYKDLDSTLTPKQRSEWDAIYASFESSSLLHGTVIGLEDVEVFPKPVEKDGTSDIAEEDDSTLTCLVIMQYMVKVLIPAPLFWLDDITAALNNVIGAEVDYVIIGIDRIGECAVASRIAALNQQKWFAREVQHIQEDDIVEASVLAVGPALLTVTACGYDVVLTPAAISYQYLEDLRDIYHVGQKLKGRVISLSDDQLSLSMREMGPDPYQDADSRHPVGSSRIGRITNKYHGGVFCRLTDGCTVVCKYAQHFSDDQFQAGDQVLIQIRSFDDKHRWLRGKIRAKI